MAWNLDKRFLERESSGVDFVDLRLVLLITELRF